MVANHAVLGVLGSRGIPASRPGDLLVKQSLLSALGLLARAESMPTPPTRTCIDSSREGAHRRNVASDEGGVELRATQNQMIESK